MDLKTLRTSKRITQWDLRNKTGISQTKICLIERGYIEPRTEEKKKIATALGVKKSFKKAYMSTVAYTANVNDGLDVTRGFYKETGTLD